MATKAPRPNTTRRAIYDYIKDHPGKTGVEVGNALGISQQDASGPLSHLYAAGKLERQKVPGAYGKYAYFVPDRERATQPEIRYITREPDHNEWFLKLKKEAATYEAARDRLEIEVVELRQWKAEAIAKYPDLVPPPVDPLLLKARQIAAEVLRESSGLGPVVETVLAGDMDDAPAVKAALLALTQDAE